MRARILSIGLAFAFAFAPLAADAAPSAKDKAQAKSLASDARAAAKAGKYNDAANAFTSAIAIDPSAQLELELGRTYVQLGKLVEAKASLESAIDAAGRSKTDKKVGDAAQKALDDVTARVPSIRVAIAGPDAGSAHTTIDAKPVDAGADVALDPGEHVVASDADGFDHAEQTIVLAEGKHQKVKLTLAKVGAPAAPAVATKDEDGGGGGSKTPAIIAIGIGVVGVGVGAVFGIMALNDKSAADKDCSGSNCSLAAEGSINHSLTEGNVSTVAFIVGGVGLGLGTILLIARPGSKKAAEKSDAASFEPWIGAGRAGFSGRF